MSGCAWFWVCMRVCKQKCVCVCVWEHSALITQELWSVPVTVHCPGGLRWTTLHWILLNTLSPCHHDTHNYTIHSSYPTWAFDPWTPSNLELTQQHFTLRLRWLSWNYIAIYLIKITIRLPYQFQSWYYSYCYVQLHGSWCKLSVKCCHVVT